MYMRCIGSAAARTAKVSRRGEAVTPQWLSVQVRDRLALTKEQAETYESASEALRALQSQHESSASDSAQSLKQVFSPAYRPAAIATRPKLFMLHRIRRHVTEACSRKFCIFGWVVVLSYKAPAALEKHASRSTM